MTYLGFPRLHFSGSFQADPSTVNNDPYHFDTAAFQPEWDEPAAGATKGWWNPEGTGAWRLHGCSVRSVAYADGSTCDDRRSDPVVGMPVRSATDRVAAKIVDLDPEQQMVSQIWGLQVELGDVGRPNTFRGQFAVAAFADIWVRFPAGRPDSFFSATYQSVLDALQWSEEIDSKFLSELGRAERLSIKFTVDGFDDDSSSPRFTLGRLSGAIGPYADGEPHHLVAARMMRPVTPGPNSLLPALNFAPFRVDGDRLFLDLANSLPTTGPGGPLQDLGPLEVALLPAGAPPVPIGTVNPMTPGWYEDRAGIEVLTLTPEQLQAAASTPVGVIVHGPGGPATMLREDADGTFVRADRFVFRMEPGVPASTTLYATRFGAPAAGQQIELTLDNSVMQTQQTQGVGHGPPVGVPADALTFPPSVTIGPDGTAEVALDGTDPGNPRGYIDGQVYGVRYDWTGVDLCGYAADTMNLISVLLWDAYQPAPELTWMDDIRPVLEQYADLYPVMRNVLDLDDYHSVVKNGDSLEYVFALPVEDPNYMPAVRDLSPAKRGAITSWLKQQPHPAYMRTTTVEDVRRALQQAIELEHATIPPYLTALFSIRDGHNRQVAEIIRSVVMEEMLHMALACNVLNAIGGEPQIGMPGFVPRYPAKLPGGLRPDLTVTLRKASIQQVHDVFMAIEEPEQTIHPRGRHALTIGWFYGHIERGLEALATKDPSPFTGDPARQVSGWRGPGELFAVTGWETAKRAIKEITDQGEGTSPIDPADGYDEIAHFYRFEEIVRGRRIVLEPEGYSFTGPAVHFDPDGVWPMIDDPTVAKLPKGSLVRRRAEAFDELYWSLLGRLHEAFNGRPERLNGAIELMFSLEVAAKQLMQTPIAPGAAQTAGPPFRDRRPLPADAEPAARRKPLTMKGQPEPASIVAGRPAPAG